MNPTALLLSFSSIPWLSSLPISSADLSQTAGALLFSAIWQGVVIAACLAIGIRYTKRISGELRFAIWSAGFLFVLWLPFIPLFFRFVRGITGTTVALSGAPSNPASHSLIQLDIRWSIAITLLWVTLSLYRISDLIVHSVRLRGLWKSAVPIDLDKLELAPLAPLWGRKQIQICTTDELERPSVIGFLSPKILIPRWLISNITPGELNQVILHETEHLRRGDDWTNLFQKLSLAIFPLNPVLYWIEKQLCAEREMACDEAVVRRTHAPRAYAACLTNLAERSIERRTESVSTGALSLGAWQRRSELVRRVHRILLHKPELGSLGTSGVLAATIFGLVLGSAELSRSPQLIAFTAAPKVVAGQLPAFPQIPISSPTIDPGFSESASIDANQMTPLSRSHMTELKAIMPARRDKPFENTNSRRPTDSNVPRTRSTPSSQSLAVNQAPAGAFLTSTSIEPASTLNPEELAQAKDQENSSWIVLTSWEEIETRNPDASQAENKAASDPDSAGRTTGIHVVTQPQTRLTVTRLILRVVPANSKLTSPTVLPLRSGWFVIQL